MGAPPALNTATHLRASADGHRKEERKKRATGGSSVSRSLILSPFPTAAPRRAPPRTAHWSMQPAQQQTPAPPPPLQAGAAEGRGRKRPAARPVALAAMHACISASSRTMAATPTPARLPPVSVAAANTCASLTGICCAASSNTCPLCSGSCRIQRPVHFNRAPPCGRRLGRRRAALGAARGPCAALVRGRHVLPCRPRRLARRCAAAGPRRGQPTAPTVGRAQFFFRPVCTPPQFFPLVSLTWFISPPAPPPFPP